MEQQNLEDKIEAILLKKRETIGLTQTKINYDEEKAT